MEMIHGQNVTAQDVESAFSIALDAKLFAALCNDVAWGIVGRETLSLPSFTERINVRDKGIDAEWDTELPEANYSSALLGPGWNVFQYKQRNIFGQGRDRTFATLKSASNSGMKGAVHDLYRANNRRPDRYVLFTNLDLSHDQKSELREAILTDYDDPDAVHVEVVGAAELARFLNDLPHLRAAYFVRSRFSTWEVAWSKHQQSSPIPSITLIGREKVLDDLRRYVDDAMTRVVILSGPYGVGKSRLVLQATAHRSVETVMAVDPNLNVSDLPALERHGAETIVILDDPAPDTLEALVHAAATSRLKLLIALPTEEGILLPNYGLDDRLKVIPILPLSEMEADELLRMAEPEFDYNIFFWVLERAGGIPRILLMAAKYGKDLRSNTDSFTDAIAKETAKWIKLRLGNDTLKVLSLLSLLSQVRVGINRTSTEEIEPICKVFGGSTDVNSVSTKLPMLEKAGFLRTRNFDSEVLPPLLANHLAASLLRGRFDEALMLFRGLESEGRTRFVGRLCLLKGEEVALQFLSMLFEKEGPLGDLRSALGNVGLLLQVAGTMPEPTSRLVLHGLQSMTVEERAAIQSYQRRQLVFAIEQILFRRITSADALRCVALLAEAENVTYDKHATDLFCEAFQCLHSQVPLPLSQRLSILNDVLSEENSISLRLVGIQAIERGLDRMHGNDYHHSRGPDPFDQRPSLMWAEVFDYMGSLLNILLHCARADASEVADSARALIPRALIAYAVVCPPEQAQQRFVQVVEWVLMGEVPVPVADLARALRNTQHAWDEMIGRNTDEWAGRYRTGIAALEVLAEQIENAEFPIRLRRWAGRMYHEDYEVEDDESGDGLSRSNFHLRALALEVLSNPSLLTHDLLAWLCSSQAEMGPQFFYWLGDLDTECRWLPQVEALAANQSGVFAFAAYCHGLSHHNAAAVVQRLDELAEDFSVVAEAIVLATRWLPTDTRNVQRLVNLVREKKVSPGFVERYFSVAEWITNLRPEDCLALLDALAGPEHEHASVVIDLLEPWLRLRQPTDGALAQLAWECLEAEQSMRQRDSYSYDMVAYLLAKQDIERGFQLLEALLLKHRDGHHWMPIAHMARNEFWHFLRHSDSSRAVRILLSAVQHNSYWRIGFLHDIENAFVLTEDGDALVAYARESEEHAELICHLSSSAHSGFWPIAFAIIEKYQDSENVRKALDDSVLQMHGVISGSCQSHIRGRYAEIQRVLADAMTPVFARSWLSQLSQSFPVEARGVDE
jgi:hypothetical protein